MTHHSGMVKCNAFSQFGIFFSIKWLLLSPYTTWFLLAVHTWRVLYTFRHCPPFCHNLLRGTRVTASAHTPAMPTDSVDWTLIWTWCVSVFVRAWVGILRISTDICNLLSVDFLLIPCTFLYQYIFRQKPFMTQYTEHTQKLLHVSTSRCHLQWVTMKQNADLLNNLLIYHKLAGWPVHLCHSNSLKMATGCWNM